MRNMGNGISIVTLLASAAAAGLLFVLATVGLVLGAVFVLVFLGITLFSTRKNPMGQFAKFKVFGNLRGGSNRPQGKEPMNSGDCYDLRPEDYTSSSSPTRLRAGEKDRRG